MVEIIFPIYNIYHIRITLSGMCRDIYINTYTLVPVLVLFDTATGNKRWSEKTTAKRFLEYTKQGRARAHIF